MLNVDKGTTIPICATQSFFEPNNPWELNNWEFWKTRKGWLHAESAASFRVFSRLKSLWCLPATARQKCRWKWLVDQFYEEAWKAVEAVRQENRPGSMATSRPVRHGDSMVPAAQEHASPIRSRADQTTLAAGGRRHPPQPSSAVVSAVVIGHFARQQGMSPYCIRTDLVQNQKETGFCK